MMGAKEHAIRRLLISTVCPATLIVLALSVTGCDDRLARMEQNQVRLEAMVAANARQLATVSSQVYVNNNDVQANLQKLDRNDMDLAGGISTVQNQQGTLHEAVTTASQTLGQRMTSLDENQRHLQDGVTQVAGVTQKTATDVTAIAQEHATLHQMVQSSRKELGDSIAVVAANQDKTRTDIGQLQQRHQALADQLVALAASQDRIHSGLDGLNKLMQLVANDVTAVAQGQAGLRQALDEHKAVFADKAVILEQNQRTMQASVDGIAGQTKQNAESIGAVATNQAALQQTLGANHQTVTGQVAAVIDNQRSLQADIRTLSNKTGQTASQLTALASQQDALRQTIQNHDKAADNQMANLVAGQEQAQSSLDTVTGTTGQTALDVIGIAGGQDALRQTLRSREEVVAGRIADLASNQQQTQSGLDTVVATTGQTALDVIALNDGQLRLAQAAQTDRQELAAKLTGIVQSQQQWAQRLDAAQANAQTIAAGIATLEQHITKLQGSLQPSLDGLTNQIGATGQGRAQFEAKVNQDVQAIAEALSQLRQDQTSLADQMQQIQKRTQSQTKDIIMAIQQLKQSPAEVKVSDASGVTVSDSPVKASESGTKLESSVAEAEAK